MRNLVIRTQQLTKYYGSSCGIDNLTFDVEPGEVFGLLGGSKSGKTTTLRVLLDLVRPTSGSAYILGLDTHKHSLAVRRRLGYMPAVLPVFKHLTGRQFLQELSGSQTLPLRQDIRDLTNRFGLDLDRDIHHLSGCEKQVLNVAQACQNQPDLFLMDDPTNGMDASARGEFYSWVMERRMEGVTILLASDSISEVEKICDRVAVLKEGRLVSLERVIQLKSRLLRRVEIRFGESVSMDAFTAIPNVSDITLERNTLRCTVKGDPDTLLKTASRYRVIDFLSRALSIEDVVDAYFSEPAYAL
jgi:ABC-2 type transport system ATP-binding protein